VDCSSSVADEKFVTTSSAAAVESKRKFIDDGTCNALNFKLASGIGSD